MQWQAIRQHYPHQWLLLEALKAHREGGKRILDQLAVLETYTDSITALQAYKILHGQASGSPDEAQRNPRNNNPKTRIPFRSIRSI